MRRPVLCILLSMVLTFTAVQPFAGLNAAELWNSQKKNSANKTYYYNKSTQINKGETKLYNSKSQSYNPSAVGGGVKKVLIEYQNFKFSKQHSSKLWQFMSSSAVENRQADIDNALQIEYETLKATAKHMAVVYKEDKASQMKANNEYKQELADYSSKKEVEDLEKQEKKDYILNGGKNYSSKSSGKKRVYKLSSKSTGSGIKLKKPKPLFNSPNK